MIAAEGVRADELFSVEARVALVTGGSRGIGRMVAEALVRRGAKVYIAARREADLRETATELSALGTCIPLAEDLSSGEGCRTLAARLAEREHALDVLVNNAGATWGAGIDDYPVRGWDKVLDVNVTAVFALTQSLLGPLRAAAIAERPASVINVGSIEGFSVPLWENYAYPASKAAVHQLTRQLALRLARDHIRVNAIAPGYFPSRMTAFALDDPDHALVERTPLGRLGRSEDVAGIAIYLASNASAFVTGAIVPVDGGMATTR